MAESFALLLKRHRVAAGLSQESLAELAGVSADAISALERGTRRAPHKTTLDLLIAALAVDDIARAEIEEAAKVARARGPQAHVHELLRSNLSPQLTSFVDREAAVAEIKKLIQADRLITVVGAGGVGKTRCALQVAEGLLDSFNDGVWLAEFAPLSDPSQVANVIARALSVQEAPNQPILDTVLAYLKRRRLLLILDNCEHVIEEARRVAGAILHGCPNVRILATSRERFSIAGEQVYRMPSLPVPTNPELQSFEDTLRFGAVQLFSDRAASADNRFILTVDSAPHVADICRRLDGIPLAIELAAARVKLLSPHELARKLDERFAVLTGGDRSALPRHQTMRALIDWSYDLLSEDERAIFRRLSIFAGGFTLETAAGVCIEGAADEIVILDRLSSLVDKSLVQVEMAGDDTRYRLLESTRAYAREKLTEAEEYETAARAHASAFIVVAEELDRVSESTPDRALQRRIEPEMENFRAALSWAFSTHGDVLVGQHLTGLLRRVWYAIIPSEGRRWVQIAQQRVTADTPAAIVAALDLADARLGVVFGQFKASLAAAERALARYRELGDGLGIALAELGIGYAQEYLGESAEAERWLGHALESTRSLGAHKSVAHALEGLALVRSYAGDNSGARKRHIEALEASRAAGADRYAANIAMNLAETEFRDGDAAAALRLASEALRVFNTFHDLRHVANAECNLAAYLVALRRYDEARTAARDALASVHEAQWSIGLACTLEHFAAIAALRPSADAAVIEDRQRAARIIGYVDTRRSELEAVREFTEQQEYDAIIHALRDTLGEEELSKLMCQGSTWTEDQAVAESMLI